VLLAHQMGNKVNTRVYLSDIVGLLGVNREEEGVKLEMKDDGARGTNVKAERIF
jgi:hypothetical protein